MLYMPEGRDDVLIVKLPDCGAGIYCPATLPHTSDRRIQPGGDSLSGQLTVKISLTGLGDNANAAVPCGKKRVSVGAEQLVAVSSVTESLNAANCPYNRPPGHSV